MMQGGRRHRNKDLHGRRRNWATGRMFSYTSTGGSWEYTHTHRQTVLSVLEKEEDTFSVFPPCPFVYDARTWFDFVFGFGLHTKLYYSAHALLPIAPLNTLHYCMMPMHFIA